MGWVVTNLAGRLGSPFFGGLWDPRNVRFCNCPLLLREEVVLKAVLPSGIKKVGDSDTGSRRGGLG